MTRSETGSQPNLDASLIDLAIAAGARIMEIYSEPVDVDQKSDGSPVTRADEAAEEIILDGLGRLFPNVPVVAEEAVEAGRVPDAAETYFLVDPLDGTKEFINRNGEFTVNIALIDKGIPVFGVVLAPALGKLYWGGTLPVSIGGTGSAAGALAADVVDGKPENASAIAVRATPPAGLSVLASRSHLSEETAALIEKLNVAERLSVGSSLKLCWVAAGKADIYPRLSPTMQWDIAAGHAVLRAAGGHVLLSDSSMDLTYRLPPGAAKPDLLNEHFIALSDPALLASVA